MRNVVGERNIVTIYQEAIIRAAEQTKTENTFQLALTLSKEYNRSFESILDDFEVAPEEREIFMERYYNTTSAKVMY